MKIKEREIEVLEKMNNAVLRYEVGAGHLFSAFSAQALTLLIILPSESTSYRSEDAGWFSRKPCIMLVLGHFRFHT